MTPHTTIASTLGQIAAARPASIAVFERFGLDYCCGGRAPLSQACNEAGLETSSVLDAIHRAEQAPRDDAAKDWTTSSMTALTEHIEATHHAFVRDALQRLAVIVPRVVRAHGERDARLVQLASVVSTLAVEMRDHMEKEEVVLFPMLRANESAASTGSAGPERLSQPIACMIAEHESAGAALASIRTLTDGFAIPRGACPTYRSMLTLLHDLERDMHVHVHKENNILFPAALHQRACNT